MSRRKTGKLVLLAAAAVSACALAAAPSAKPFRPAVALREAPEQVVLYTIHRGSYDNGGAAIGSLFAVVGEKGLKPRGNLAFTYLNNPSRWSKEHLLTEISIPVDRDALKLAGTLGAFTDVKVVPASTLAVVVKPVGMADPTPVYEALMTWMRAEGYEAEEGPCEVFPAGASRGTYEQMATEIMMPVRRLPEDKAK